MTKAKPKKGNEYDIAMVGWERQNPEISIVLLSMAERSKLDVKIGQPIRVKKGKNKVIACVQPQFKEVLGFPDTCSINSKVAEALSIEKGDKVELDSKVTESEYKAFKDEQKEALARVFDLMSRQIVSGDGAS